MKRDEYCVNGDEMMGGYWLQALYTVGWGDARLEYEYGVLAGISPNIRLNITRVLARIGHRRRQEVCYNEQHGAYRGPD